MKILLCIGQDHTFQVKIHKVFAKNPIENTSWLSLWAFHLKAIRVLALGLVIHFL
jgi:hypothetical protein